VTVELLEQLVAEFAGEIASRVKAELAPPASSNGHGVPWPGLLNLAEASRMLGRSERWLRERVKRGELPVVRLDRGPLAFDIDDLRAFTRSRRVPE
jgi:hypothetical protein